MTTEFKVPGMACDGCASAITNAIKEQDPGALIDVDLEKKIVKIQSSQEPNKIRALIESAGYPVLNEA